MAREPHVKFAIANQSIFHDLGNARGKFARRQRTQRIDIRHNATRLMKRADHVFTERVVHAGFTADRRIDLRQQCCRHLNERNAALIASRCEARHIADHATTQRNQRSGSIMSALKKVIENRVQLVERFVLLAIGKNHAVDTL